MENQPNICEQKCNCKETLHSTQLIVITGGPGAGKTAILEMAKTVLCEHIAILPEAASIVFGGGFWRLPSNSGKLAAQKAIFHIQTEMENLVLNERKWAAGLCDRGTLDGLAYWPTSPESFWAETGASLAKELARYKAVLHLRTPTDLLGYNHQNPLRIENAKQAFEIDQQIAEVWSKHPHYHTIPSSENFLMKAQQAIRILSDNLPECCREGLKTAI